MALNIDYLLGLSENQLYGLLGNKHKATTKGKWTRRGLEEFERFREKLYEEICDKWEACRKLANFVFDDPEGLKRVVQEIAEQLKESVFPEIRERAHNLAVIVVRKEGLEKFCNCS
jgi:hypothetical protein